MIHTVKGFGVVNKAVDVFLKLSCFFDVPTDVGNLISGSSDFSKSSLNIWMFMVHVLLMGSQSRTWFSNWKATIPPSIYIYRGEGLNRGQRKMPPGKPQNTASHGEASGTNGGGELNWHPATPKNLKLAPTWLLWWPTETLTQGCIENVRNRQCNVIRRGTKSGQSRKIPLSTGPCISNSSHSETVIRGEPGDLQSYRSNMAFLAGAFVLLKFTGWFRRENLFFSYYERNSRHIFILK